MTRQTKFRTEQEEFWAGEFGANYIYRNKSDQLLASNLVFLSKALRNIKKITSCIEFGANIGMNLKALKLLYPDISVSALEINAVAAKELSKVVHPTSIHHGSILDFKIEEAKDLVLIKGVLIHINPDFLSIVYQQLVNASNRYVLIAEYFNPTPIMVTYRGHSNRLYKRDFCGELMDQHPEVSLVDYGFCYSRDPKFPQDDITWFLLEKK
jgi:pseudaminic acid biosynthesis-associated methylase